MLRLRTAGACSPALAKKKESQLKGATMFHVSRSGAGLKDTIRLVDDEAGSSAKVAVNFGFNCFSFQCTVAGQVYDLLHAPPNFPSVGDKATAFGTPILVPFPNRIGGGKFEWSGQRYALPLNDHGNNAIHGFAVDQGWRVTGSGASPGEGAWVTGTFCLSDDRPEFMNHWPTDFSVSFTYRLRGQRLSTEIVVENPDNHVLPFGVGTHPYFRFPLEATTPLDLCSIKVPAAQHVELDHYLPTGRLTPVTEKDDLRQGIFLSSRTLDDVYTDLQTQPDGRVVHELRDEIAKVKLQIEHTHEFPFVVIYTPPHRQSICIEPYTCVTNAINLSESSFSPGLWQLAPHEKRSLEIHYVVSEIA
jgi:aldose 1-epimerase